jgi:hypothetical protein
MKQTRSALAVLSVFAAEGPQETSGGGRGGGIDGVGQCGAIGRGMRTGGVPRGHTGAAATAGCASGRSQVGPPRQSAKLFRNDDADGALPVPLQGEIEGAVQRIVAEEGEQRS